MDDNQLAQARKVGQSLAREAQVRADRLEATKRQVWPLAVSFVETAKAIRSAANEFGFPLNLQIPPIRVNFAEVALLMQFNFSTDFDPSFRNISVTAGVNGFQVDSKEYASYEIETVLFYFRNKVLEIVPYPHALVDL